MFSFILDCGDAQASTARTSTKEVLLESPANRLPNVLSILDEETCLNSSLFLLAFGTIYFFRDPDSRGKISTVSVKEIIDLVFHAKTTRN